MKVMILGVQSHFDVVDAIPFEGGWMLKASVSEASQVRLTASRTSHSVPVETGFDAVPDSWSRGLSSDPAAAVWFRAESLEEAKALRNLTTPRYDQRASSVIQFALMPGHSEPTPQGNATFAAAPGAVGQ